MVPGILGGSKENIEITPSPHDPEKIQVSYGLMPLYEVSADKNAIDFRLMVANLFLRGVKKKEIVERFGVTYVTARKWAEAVESTEDYEELVSKLQGNKRLKKLSPEIIGFIRGRFKTLYSKSRKGYNTKIREEVKELYNINLAPEMIRIHTMDIREELSAQEPHVEHDDTEEVGFTTRIKVKRQEFSYAGVCTIFPRITKLLDGLEDVDSPHGFPTPVRRMMALFIIQTLLGAGNLEQSRFMDQEALGFLCGMKRSPCVEIMRQYLRAYAQGGISQQVQDVFMENMVRFLPSGNDYFIDGHFLPYYGDAEILKGWCSRRHLSMKGNVHYFIHNISGDPLYFELQDNFHDYRLILQNFARLLSERGNGKPFWMIYDRGGFSVDVFNTIGMEGGYFVTWEKGFKGNPYMSFPRQMKMKRHINNLEPTDKIHIEYAVEDDHQIKDAKLRRIIIKYTNRKGGEKISSILTNDTKSTAPSLVRKILHRWRQENDFKMESDHFGIRYITSYETMNYKDIEDLHESRRVKTGEYIACTHTLQGLREKRDTICRELGRKIAKKAVKEELASGKLDADSRRILKYIEQVDKEISQVQEERRSVQQTIDKIDKCIKEDKKRHDFRPKTLMDSVKVATRNAYYDAARDLLGIYDNRRNYHAVLRKLITQPGYLKRNSDGEIVVQIKAFGSDQIQAVCRQFLNDVNDSEPHFLDGHNPKFLLELV